jgi:hypothetical protein
LCADSVAILIFVHLFSCSIYFFVDL